MILGQTFFSPTVICKRYILTLSDHSQLFELELCGRTQIENTNFWWFCTGSINLGIIKSGTSSYMHNFKQIELKRCSCSLVRSWICYKTWPTGSLMLDLFRSHKGWKKNYNTSYTDISLWLPNRNKELCLYAHNF